MEWNMDSRNESQMQSSYIYLARGRFLMIFIKEWLYDDGTDRFWYNCFFPSIDEIQLCCGKTKQKLLWENTKRHLQGALRTKSRVIATWGSENQVRVLPYPEESLEHITWWNIPPHSDQITSSLGNILALSVCASTGWPLKASTVDDILHLEAKIEHLIFLTLRSLVLSLNFRVFVPVVVFKW